MSMLLRSLKNLIRSPLRTALMVVLLAVSIGLALIMATVHAATQTELGDISGEIGTEITVTPAGSGSFGGMLGSGETLAQEDVDKLSDIEHVSSVQAAVQTRYTGDSLKEVEMEAPSGDGGFAGGSPPSGNRPSMGIMVMGYSADTEDVELMRGSTLELALSDYFISDNADVMLVGQNLADQNSLEVGETVNIEGTDIEVVGIYDSGTQFGDNMIVMPMETAERLFGLDGVTSVTVVADDESNVDAVVEGIREIFDEDTADVTTAQDQYERISGNVSSTRSTATIAMIVAFVVAGVVVLFSVVLMMRQRVKEIGILKAIGASNRRIGLQFSLETLAVSVVGAIIGALLMIPLAQKVADLMIDTGSTASPARFPGGGPSGIFEQVGGSLGGLHVSWSPTVFLWALLIAAGLAILASMLPAWYIARVRPAEVLRNE